MTYILEGTPCVHYTAYSIVVPRNRKTAPKSFMGYIETNMTLNHLSTDFVVTKSNLSECKFVSNSLSSLNNGELRFSVDKYAFTANNVTYGVAGDMLNYWKFFPTIEGCGRIPVWGIGTVIGSEHDDFGEGDRYYGYFPMSTTLTVQPSKVNAHGFSDGAPHRQELPPTYNQYTKVILENGFTENYENHSMLYRPLFATSFLIDDWLAENDFFGAKTLVVSSASSKTSFGLAYQAALRSDSGLRVIGLTSPTNMAFVESLGCYDEVVEYSNVTSISNNGPVGYVDMAVSAEITDTVHNHFYDQLKISCVVGLTHWQEGGQNNNLPAPTPKMFFAPDQIQKRAKELGARGFQQMVGVALSKMYIFADNHVEIIVRTGQHGVESVYQELLSGKSAPNQGYIVSMNS